MIVKIGAKEIEMTSSALTSLAYKKLFGQDILAIIGGFKGADKASEKTYDALDTVVQLGFIMAMQASISNQICFIGNKELYLHLQKVVCHQESLPSYLFLFLY